MKIITIAASALLIAAGSALAGSDHYGSDWNYPQSSTDKSHTSSTKPSNDSVRKKAPATVYRPTVPNDDYGQGHWGNH
ncbi:MAG: DUF680 domain-containing protein [Mesorhizobium sp.]|jgi:hypothetical protein